MKILPTFVLAAAGALATATASDLNFVLKNESGRSFEAVYLSADDDTDWNANLLRKGALADGASVEIRFADKPDSVLWDVNLVDDKGLSVAFNDINLLDVKTVTIRTVDGKITAVVE
ncbi:MAG: hypothetical protein Fur0032_00440 [Terrimicrobiaceae bacterium]